MENVIMRGRAEPERWDLRAGVEVVVEAVVGMEVMRDEVVVEVELEEEGVGVEVED